MYIIRKTDKEGRVFPDNKIDEGWLDDYKDTYISNLASTIGINATIGDNILLLGNSGTNVEIEFINKPGEEGKRLFEQFVKDLIDLIKEALPSMAEPYFNFFNHFVKDYEENGLRMPWI